MTTPTQFELTKAQIEVLHQNLQNLIEESTKLYKVHRAQCAELYGHDFGAERDELSCTICGDNNEELFDSAEYSHAHDAFGEYDD